MDYSNSSAKPYSAPTLIESSRASNDGVVGPKWREGDADRALDELTRTYRNSGKPVQLSFRELLPALNATERATHLIHPYPAKLLRHIPYFFLSSSTLNKDGSIILDPFCGSGTVLLEAVVAGRTAVGADTNPLARMIAKVKTQSLDPKVVRDVVRSFHQLGVVPFSQDTGGVDLRFWYSDRHLGELAALRSAIETVGDQSIRSFLWVAFSVCARQLSHSDLRVSVPVRLKLDRYPPSHWLRKRAERRLAWLESTSAFECFTDICEANLRRVQQLMDMAPWATASQVIDDARDTSAGDIPQADLVITSPPYIGAQKYIRASSLSLAWFRTFEGTTVRAVEAASIGREHALQRDYEHPAPTTEIIEADRLINQVQGRNPLRAHLAATYLVEMKQAFLSIVAATKPGGSIVIIAGGNQVAGTRFPTHQFLNEILCGMDLQQELELIDDIRSRGLMTRRNRTAALIESETISVFRKPPAGCSEENHGVH